MVRVARRDGGLTRYSASRTVYRTWSTLLGWPPTWPTSTSWPTGLEAAGDSREEVVRGGQTGDQCSRATELEIEGQVFLSRSF